jgi:hypothetical protein
LLNFKFNSRWRNCSFKWHFFKQRGYFVYFGNTLNSSDRVLEVVSKRYSIIITVRRTIAHELLMKVRLKVVIKSLKLESREITDLGKSIKIRNNSEDRKAFGKCVKIRNFSNNSEDLATLVIIDAYYILKMFGYRVNVNWNEEKMTLITRILKSTKKVFFLFKSQSLNDSTHELFLIRYISNISSSKIILSLTTDRIAELFL